MADSPPQLPLIPNTSTLATSIGGSSEVDASDAEPSGETSPGLDVAKPNAHDLSANVPSSSPAGLTVPSSSFYKQSRPHSSPEERARDPALAPQSNHSQLSFTAPHQDYGEGDSGKPSSPFRLSFGKGLLNPPAHPSDTHKRSSMAGMAPIRFKPSPDGSPADKPAVLQKDYKFDSGHARKHTDRDVSAENAHHKPGKAMLHLLNPMSLLAKRRSSQLGGSRVEDANIASSSVVPAIPDDYDPRIRGNIVHDFSAPRPRRNLSTTASILQDSPNRFNTQAPTRNEQGTPNTSGPLNQPMDQRKRHSEHSPAFKEHFDDDERLLQVENKAYLQSPLLVNSRHRNSEGSIPDFAKRLPHRLPNDDERTTSNDSEDLHLQRNEKLPETQEQDDDVVEKLPQQSIGLPKHFKSNASRFSFDMNAMESSTQEKLLEEKHKEKEAARKAKARLDGDDFSDVDDDYDNLMDDFDGLEEKIPGVNTDADDDDMDGPPGPRDIMGKSWLSPGLSPVIASPISPVGRNSATAPNVKQPRRYGSGSTGSPPVSPSDSTSVYDDSDTEDNINLQPKEVKGPPLPATNPPQPLGVMNYGVSQSLDDDYDDDDLYFDDGEFGDLGTGDGEKFDESIFDDETSHLYDRKPTAESLPPTQPEGGASSEAPLESEFIEDPAEGPGLKHVPSTASELQVGPAKYGHSSQQIPSMESIASHGGVLTEHNLEALHNALAKAANDAARTPSVSDRSTGQESVAQTVESHPGLVSDDSRLSQAVDTLGVDEVFEDFSLDDDDNALFDDPIIAAANAEALENDDEGFYGQEFGFYAQANGGCNSELTNGGYFGPRGVEGIFRNHSSRGKFREPSLTPITERSEWSTRNSVISVAAHGATASNPSLSSPGLAQLVDMGSIDDEMSLSALMKLRRDAFGGSNGSLRSRSASPPPAPNSSSNRASFTALSDVSPTGLDTKIGPRDSMSEVSPIDWPTHDSDKERSPTGLYAEISRPDRTGHTESPLGHQC